MLRLLLLLLALGLFVSPARAQTSYRVETVAPGVYAALVQPGGAASSNGFFVTGPGYCVAGGAHMTRDAIRDLLALARETTDQPVRYFILPHHHRGYSHIDFDFPPGIDVILSWESWEGLNQEVRKPAFPALFFQQGFTLKLGDKTLILTGLGRGHTDGDLLVYLPEAQVLFTSDLLYIGSVGYLGEGYMQEWVLALEFMEQLGVTKVIPGSGPVGSGQDITAFKTYFKAFLTALLQRMERGEPLEQIQREMRLPRYRKLDGYEQFLPVNIERAYQQLRDTLQN